MKVVSVTFIQVLGTLLALHQARGMQSSEQYEPRCLGGLNILVLVLRVCSAHMMASTCTLFVALVLIVLIYHPPGDFVGKCWWKFETYTDPCQAAKIFRETSPYKLASPPSFTFWLDHASVFTHFALCVCTLRCPFLLMDTELGLRSCCCGDESERRWCWFLAQGVGHESEN